MTKRVFIIHGWGGNPEEGWFPFWSFENLIIKNCFEFRYSIFEFREITMAKKNPVNTNYYWKLEDKMKAEQEKERRPKKMKVSGKSVFKLREIIAKKS